MALLTTDDDWSNHFEVTHVGTREFSESLSNPTRRQVYITQLGQSYDMVLCAMSLDLDEM